MGNYTNRDIDIFILSYNRGQFLLETIRCLLNQSIGAIEMTVLDNYSIGETAEMVSKIDDERVKVIINKENIGGLNNIKKAQDLSSKEWTIIFHDDDLIHPKYIEEVLKILNSNSEITIVAALTELNEFPHESKWKDTKLSKVLIYKNAGQFAKELFKGLPVPFCSIVYKTKLLKKAKLNQELYGKIADRPFLFDCINGGEIAVLKNVFIQSRVHIDRDSNDFLTGPFENQWILLVKKYYDIMGDSIFTTSGRTFLNRGTRTLLVTMNPHIYDDIGKKNYIALAIEKGAISKFGYFMGLPYYYTYIFAKKIQGITKQIMQFDRK